MAVTGTIQTHIVAQTLQRGLRARGTRQASVFLNSRSGDAQAPVRVGDKGSGPAPARPEPVDPRLEVVDSGYGSLVAAKLPPYSQLLTRVGRILGQSAGAQARAVPRGSAMLLGRNAFAMEITTDSAAADVLLAPQRPGDIAIVPVSGAVGYFVRHGSLLAHTRFLTVSAWRGLGSAFHALAFDAVGGRGTMALSSYGGLHRLVLQDGEQYFIDPRYVVAWSDSLTVAPVSGRPQPWQPTVGPPQPSVKSDASASAAPPAADPPAVRAAPLVSSHPTVDNKVSLPARSPADPVQTASASSLSGGSGRRIADKILSAGVYPAWRAVKAGTRSAAYAVANVVRTGGWTAAKATRTLAGVPDLYRVTGPGDIYVSTRLAPKVWTRATDAVAAKSAA
ncbi:hypothetical protein H4R19_004712 [Coemansia spiralis]|nr:hypothetical protein H4R19_004712 [Coemansia spiralis]